MSELIIFDWDDVFTLGSTEGYYRCTHEALAGVGVDLGKAEEERRVRETWPLPHREQLAAILEDYPERVDEAVSLYEDHWFGDTFVDCLSIVSGAQDFLLAISKRYQLAIATGNHPKVLIDRIFPKFQIPDVFVAIATIYDDNDPTHAKPHPFMANKLMRAAGVTAAETVLVGDAASDMEMAWNAGIEPIAVLTGHLNRQAAAELGVKHIVDQVTSIQPELNKIFKD